jgi:predicted unusual protein kinase regulating ubiquinone biosynthesis (AarF/ABC1/UbiB family)
METINKIPTSKIQRATKILATGAKVGVNYVKYGVDKMVKDEDQAKENLDKNNAEDIYNGLKQLKGSALKVAQMLSMDQTLLPQAYVDQFSLSQFSVPPLSAPLVDKTFRKYFGTSPHQIFDTWNSNALYAASIGQVHQAQKDGQKLAVKIQYPGVANSISSDLSLVKPVALRVLNLKAKDSEIYFKEVEEKLLEETDYDLELKQSLEMSDACKQIPNLLFPKYYPEYSSDRIITMDWMDGQHLSEFVSQNKTVNDEGIATIKDQKLANKIGQTLWDFYMHQMHTLKKVHADPHPGNFLVSQDAELIALDFGCLKVIPDDFYRPYFELASSENIQQNEIFQKNMRQLEMIKETDSMEAKQYLEQMFYELLETFTAPFNVEVFDFSSKEFFQKIAGMAEKYNKDPQFRKLDGNRGSRHFIYMNRTFFGLYNLLHSLGANKVQIAKYF